MTAAVRLWMLGLLILSFLSGAAPAQTLPQGLPSQAQLNELLKQFPEADANKDGILTLPEAAAYYEKLRAQRRPKTTANPNRPKPTHANVSYGPHARNVLDLYLAQSDRPTPLVIHIHGGGFVGGDKEGVSAGVIARFHKAGVSVASINYRFVTTAPFPAPQEDAARAVQFLRSKAQEWNLDPQRFAAYGGSAGAGLSLWLGFHDDLADPDSSDPVLRQSSRIQAVGSFGGQSTYDPNVIKDWIGGRAYEHPSIYLCYGISSINDIRKPELQPLYDQVSAIKHLTTDDPPVYMFYNEPDAPLPENSRPGQGIHHPIFGHKLKAEMDKLKVESVYQHASAGVRPDEELVQHFLRWLKVTPAGN